MSADRLKYKDITDIILRSFYEVYDELGKGKRRNHTKTRSHEE